MNQSKGTGYKKFKTLNNEPQHSISQWDSYSRNKHNQSSFRKKQPEEEDGQWMGSDSTPPRPDQLHNSYTNQSFEMKQGFMNQGTPKSNVSHDQAPKTPTQLIQGILKGLVSTGKLTTVNPFYSE